MRFHLQSVREALDGGRPRQRRLEPEAENETAQLSFSDLF
jgi:hypothetical protein